MSLEQNGAISDPRSGARRADCAALHVEVPPVVYDEAGFPESMDVVNAVAHADVGDEQDRYNGRHSAENDEGGAARSPSFE
jgi:hypothetical protein